MYRLATKRSEKNELQKLLHSVDYARASRKRKRHTVPPLAQSANGKCFRCLQTM